MTSLICTFGFLCFVFATICCLVYHNYIFMRESKESHNFIESVLVIMLFIHLIFAIFMAKNFELPTIEVRINNEVEADNVQ